MAPIRANRPWLHRHALGAPEVPDVNNRRPSDSSVTAVSSGSGAPHHRHRPRATRTLWWVTGHRRVVDHKDPVAGQCGTEVVALDQREVVDAGHQQLALGVGEVAGQFVAPVGGVAADDDGAGQGCGTHPEYVLGHVVHEQGHMERARGSERCQNRGAFGLRPDHVIVGPGPFAEHQARPMIAGPLTNQHVDGLHRFPLVGARRSCHRRANRRSIALPAGELGTNLEHVAIYQSPVLP